MLGNAITLGFSPQLGPELASGWNTTAFWTKSIGAGWTVNEGVSVETDGTVTEMKKFTVFTNGKKYRVTGTVARTSGNLRIYEGGTLPPEDVSATGDFSYDYEPVLTELWFSSLPFVGTMTAFSLKEIL